MIGIIGMIGIYLSAPIWLIRYMAGGRPLGIVGRRPMRCMGAYASHVKYIVSALSNYHPCVIGKKLETSLTAIIRANFGYGTRANVLFYI